MSSRQSQGVDARPLAGKTILVTRPEEGASRMGEMLADLGACVRVASMIRITEPADWTPVDAAIRALDAYQWIIFTSANGPKYLANRFDELGVAPGTISKDTSILAVGPATAAAVEKYLGKAPRKIAGKYVAEGVIELFEGEDMAGKRVLLPRAKEGRDAIPKALAEKGATLDDVSVYQTVPIGREALRGVWGELEAGKIDMLTFTSSSALDGFMRAAGGEAAKKWMAHARVASIGPATSATARSWGVAPDVEAAESTISGMARAIVSFYGEPERGGRAS
ncbi:MAG: uroporphyrinogen-III synthase [Nitrospinae bacterium]|nr:uroporphyrinogen-III synthase [Nitrospinota bacterium]